MNRPETGTMSGSHVLVKTLNRIRTGEFTELLVHVVCTRARVISKPDAKVLDFQRPLFVNLELCTRQTG
jgi:hypothetical protein